jgi:hypothetical protein
MLLAVALALTFTVSAWADGGVLFNDIAAGDNAGITYRRSPSLRLANKQWITANSPWPTPQFFQLRNNMSPQKGTGSPGVAILDYDDDGDLDVYVTNGPGTDNSLYSNQLVESGQTTFVDVAAAAGVTAHDQDSSGACFGDIDNDGDEDLYVTGTGDDPPNALYGPTGTTNRLFENNGDGTFTDITASAGVDNYGRHAIGCSFADIDNDGYLDVVVGNSYDNWGQRRPTFVNIEDPGLEHNVLYRNNGNNSFTDVSGPAGILSVSNMTNAAFTWAIAMVDIDRDGDPDILSADNQGGPSTQRSEERGWLRLYVNDGTGQFDEVTEQVGLDREGGWMGLSFGDLNCDGYLDFFGTNLGSYARLGAASRWLLNSASGQWSDPGLGPDIVADPFGWGTSMLDYDNDGDYDILYQGGVDLLASALADNPGIIFQNTGTCSGQFVWDDQTIQTDHRVRSVNGVAVGDLNQDGFLDLVSASNFNIMPVNFIPQIFITGPRGGPFDAVARVELEFFGGIMPGFQVWLDPDYVPGTLAVEINSADNGNNSVAFDTLGGRGVIAQGTVNRDGIGAVIEFTPAGGVPSLDPVVGGSSYASQDSLTSHFGLGQATSGDAEILWPGGARNRLYDVQAGERLLLPEIPCSFDANWGTFGHYNACVMQALNGYKDAGIITAAEKNRLRDSARRAYHESH